MIVVEGFDCTGKSTLAAKIAGWTDMPVVHTGGPTRDEMDVFSSLARSLDRMHQRVVQDRCTHVSESVYSLLTRPRHAAIAMGRHEDMRHARLLVYCRPPEDMILRALRDHKDKVHDTTDHMAFVRSAAPVLIRAYDTMITFFCRGTNFVLYDWTEMKDQAIVDIVTEIRL